MNACVRRAEDFAQSLGLSVPLLLAPMAGVPAPALSIGEIAKAGAMSACGYLIHAARRNRGLDRKISRRRRNVVAVEYVDAAARA
ncbi:MAG: hypothetical protein R3C42_08465 [Parvularculaceae bacterium]